eukprot:1036981-Rhodomonas_salina.1
MPVLLRRWPGVEVSVQEERSTQSMRELLGVSEPCLLEVCCPRVLVNGAEDAHDEAVEADIVSWEFVGEELCCAVVLHVFAGGCVLEVAEFDGVAACKFNDDDAGFGFAALRGVDNDDAVGNEVCDGLRAVRPELVDSEGGVGRDD